MWGETSLKEDPELRTPLQRGQCVLSPLHTWSIDTLGICNTHKACLALYSIGLGLHMQ